MLENNGKYHIICLNGLHLTLIHKANTYKWSNVTKTLVQSFE